MAKFSGISCGIKKDKKDLGLILPDDGSTVFGFFTSNRIKSEAIERAQKIIGGRPNNKIKAVYVLSGNALCRYFGVEKDIQTLVKKFSQDLTKFFSKTIKPDQIVLLSTGKIGVGLDVEKVLQNSYKSIESLHDDVSDFSEAILTTDTKPKVSKFEKNGLYILGVAKGAGMIFPNFSHATTLSFVITNAYLPKGFERNAYEILQKTIGSINIDSSQSTNDSCVFIFENKRKFPEKLLKEGLQKVLGDLAFYIAEDGEGVRHVVRISVLKAQSDRSAKNICSYISFSFLFRSSISGSSPDFGRVLSAIGSSGEKIGKIRAWVSRWDGSKRIEVIKNSKIITENLKNAAEIMKDQKYNIQIDVGLKQNGKYSMLITDITEDYIAINKTM
ncbi:MAG: bifunctional ornithine acetyltransferase/N-acetylglutamate synthase [Candidatus Calescibacterium sp.]|nr:bifunctional ornithine acetyltransferase/N-acetylglutamate synthase [Candidatus Calescibacterium sp.]MDW8086846.1 bifunctional ornithine acetyltransferase/N-acetylglutamate synthase [Candidatus Calescibacterium sp.]